MSTTEPTGQHRTAFDRRRLLKAAAGATLAGTIGTPVIRHALAQQATPVASPVTNLPANVTVFAEGLASPRFLAFDPAGTLYVTEGGAAGDEAIFATPQPGTPVPVEAVTERGATGRVSAIAPDGTRTVLAEGFPSYSFGAEIVGPAGIAVAEDGRILLATGGAGPALPIVTPLEAENAVIAIDPASGAWQQLANIGEYELAMNPDPNAIDSNCYGLAAGNGVAYIADAGGNTVYRLDLATNELAVHAVIPALPGTDPNPNRGGRPEVDPVPTGLALLPDGTLLVAQLGGAPFAPGSAGILKVAPDGAVANWAGGLTMVMDVKVAPDGTVYATELSGNFLAQPPAPGRIVRIGIDGASDVVLDGLAAPAGLAIDAEGSLYVAVNTVGAPEGGAILKITDPATIANVLVGTPVAEASPVAAVEPSAPEVLVELKDLAFVPKDIEIPANVDVTLVVRNIGNLPHDLTSRTGGIDSGTVAAGSEEVITVNLAPGTYNIQCSIAGHRRAGMVGTLTAKHAV